MIDSFCRLSAARFVAAIPLRFGFLLGAAALSLAGVNATQAQVTTQVLIGDSVSEIGNRYGGSTLALAHLCDQLSNGKVIGLDISHRDLHETVAKHPRITLIEGDACASFEKVQQLIPTQANVLVIEDSAHTFENTLNVLRTYSPLVKKGGYFIVEDGICHHGLDVGPDPGPYEAIEAFILENNAFEVDRSRESFLITWNPKGYLRRISG